MISVKIEMSKTAREYFIGKEFKDTEELTLPEGTRVVDLFERLQIRPSDIGRVFVNNKAAKNDEILQGGDVVQFVPLLAGG